MLVVPGKDETERFANTACRTFKVSGREMQLRETSFGGHTKTGRLVERLIPMVKDGSYVRLALLPETRMGTLRQIGQIGDQPQFVFQLDPRFKEKLADFPVEEDDVEECERPSDDDINETNRILDLEPKG